VGPATRGLTTVPGEWDSSGSFRSVSPRSGDLGDSCLLGILGAGAVAGIKTPANTRISKEKHSFRKAVQWIHAGELGVSIVRVRMVFNNMVEGGLGRPTVTWRTNQKERHTAQARVCLRTPKIYKRKKPACHFCLCCTVLSRLHYFLQWGIPKQNQETVCMQQELAFGSDAVPSSS